MHVRERTADLAVRQDGRQPAEDPTSLSSRRWPRCAVPAQRARRCAPRASPQPWHGAAATLRSSSRSAPPPPA